MNTPWHFNLNDLTQGIQRQLGEGISTRVFPGDQAMLSIVRLEPHSRGQLHAHPQEQWGVLLEGACTRIQDGEEIAMKVGDFWCTPGNVEHGVYTGEDGATVLDIFSPPRDEYKNAGSGFAT